MYVAMCILFYICIIIIICIYKYYQMMIHLYSFGMAQNYIEGNSPISKSPATGKHEYLL